MKPLFKAVVCKYRTKYLCSCNNNIKHFIGIPLFCALFTATNLLKNPNKAGDKEKFRVMWLILPALFSNIKHKHFLIRVLACDLLHSITVLIKYLWCLLYAFNKHIKSKTMFLFITAFRLEVTFHS